MANFFAKQGGQKRKADEGSSAPCSSKGPVRSVPWVEKYRPRTVNDVAHQDEVVAVLRKTMEGNEFPNLLFYGPPGTGKTSTILAVARQLFGCEGKHLALAKRMRDIIITAGKESNSSTSTTEVNNNRRYRVNKNLWGDLYKSRVLELNASDERGIQVVRDKVKSFAHLAVSSKRLDGTPCPSFKIVILDEADSMTSSAQAALRRTMETQTKTTRFCLICNYVSRIIEPLTSRCAKFRFQPLSIDTITDRLKLISDKENVNISESAINDIIKVSEGDMRMAITFLQSAHRLRQGELVESNTILEIAGEPPSSIIENLISACKSGSHEKLTSVVENIISEGYSAAKITSKLHDEALTIDSFSDRQKAFIMERMAVTDKCLCDGADEYLQLMALSTVIMEQATRAG